MSGQGNLNKLTEQVNLTSADQQLSSQWPAPYVVMDPSYLASGECSAGNWGFNLSTKCIRQLTLSKLFDDDDAVLLRHEFGSMAPTRDTNPNWESSSTPMPSPEDGEGVPNPNVLPQRFNPHDHNSEGCVDDQSFEPDRRDLTEETPNEPSVTPIEHVKRHLDIVGTPSQACSGKKRTVSRTIIPCKDLKHEIKQKKRDADKKYRADIKRELNKLRRMKAEYDRVMELVSRFEGIDEMVSQINHMNSEQSRQLFETEQNRLEQMKSKYGGFHEMESMLDRFMEMEAESHVLNQIKSKLGIHETQSLLQKIKEMEEELRRWDQIKSSFGGVDEIEAGINRLKKIELQLEKHKHMESQNEVEPFQTYPDDSKERSRWQLLDLNDDSDNVSYQCGINLNSFDTEIGRTTTPELQYSDVLVDQLIAKLTDENLASKLDTNSFKDVLDGAWESVSSYKIPSALVSTARHIFDVYGDITKNCKLSGLTVQAIFVLLCAAIQEMGDLTLDQVTEEIIWKLRDPIMDAKRSDFNVDFAMKYLKLLVQGYFGLKARKYRSGLEKIIASLMADESALKTKLEKKSQEIKVFEAKQRELSSEKCRICLDTADKLLRNCISIF